MQLIAEYFNGVSTMLVGVLSDTHDHVSNTLKAIEYFINKDIDLIIHLGDIISPFMPRFIKRFVEERGAKLRLHAVLGNNDGDVYLLYKLFSEYGWALYSGPVTIDLDGKHFYLMHGHGSPEFTENMALLIAEKMNVSGVLYGHTHKRVLKYVDNKLLLNPGEVCGYLSGEATIALLNTDDLKVEFIQLR